MEAKWSSIFLLLMLAVDFRFLRGFVPFTVGVALGRAWGDSTRFMFEFLLPKLTVSKFLSWNGWKNGQVPMGGKNCEILGTYRIRPDGNSQRAHFHSIFSDDKLLIFFLVGKEMTFICIYLAWFYSLTSLTTELFPSSASSSSVKGGFALRSEEADDVTTVVGGAETLFLSILTKN